MKALLSVAISVAVLGACAATGPETAWGKPGASKFDYVTDLGTCSAMAAMAEAGNGANTAGGLNGSNNSAPAPTGGDAAKAARQAGGPTPGAATPTGGSVYRDSVPTDMANRAASQQTTQQMAGQRLRADTLKNCYAERGYQEFKLTPEQRAHLGSLEKGSNDYLQYLSDIATDPALLKSNVAVAPKPGS